VVRTTIEAWEFKEGRKIVKMLEWDGTDTPERIREVAELLDKAVG
jgi:glycerol kinase